MSEQAAMAGREARLGAIAEEYHAASRNQAGWKHLLNQHQAHYSDEVQRLAAEAPLHLEGGLRTQLPKERSRIGASLQDAIEGRRSSRDFRSACLPLQQLATLLRLGGAVRVVAGSPDAPQYRRQAPNSGNLGSVEVFPIALNVEGLEAGIHHFDSVRHELSLIRGGELSTWLADKVFYQQEFARASAVLVLVSALSRLTAKYGPRAYRLALLDVGHVSQNLQLTASALGLQACASAGFIDDELDAAIGLDGRELASMLTVLVGPAAD